MFMIKHKTTKEYIRVEVDREYDRCGDFDGYRYELSTDNTNLPYAAEDREDAETTLAGRGTGIMPRDPRTGKNWINNEYVAWWTPEDYEIVEV
jgi:hypothetical protein